MEVPAELASRFKFAKQKSKLAGTIRGSFFVINASQVWPPSPRQDILAAREPLRLVLLSEGGRDHGPPGFHQGRPFPAGVAGARFDTDRPHSFV